MVKAKSNDSPDQVQYLVALQSISDHVTLENLPTKFRILCGGVGTNVLDLQPVDQAASDQELVDTQNGGSYCDSLGVLKPRSLSRILIGKIKVFFWRDCIGKIPF